MSDSDSDTESNKFVGSKRTANNNNIEMPPSKKYTKKGGTTHKNACGKKGGTTHKNACGKKRLTKRRKKRRTKKR